MLLIDNLIYLLMVLLVLLIIKMAHSKPQVIEKTPYEQSLLNVFCDALSNGKVIKTDFLNFGECFIAKNEQYHMQYFPKKNLILYSRVYKKTITSSDITLSVNHQDQKKIQQLLSSINL